MQLQEALAVVKAAGYRVSKPRAKPRTKLVQTNDGGWQERPVTGLNAIGKPYGANFDPNYRMRYRTPALKRTQNVSANALSPEQWALMCKLAQAQWNNDVAAATKLAAA